jgi:phage regulator Rha-like protein
MNELVQLTTQDVSRGVPVTTSEILAEQYNVKHRAVQQLVSKYEADFSEFGKVSFQMRPSKSGQNEKIYYLNEEHFYLLVTYMKNTEIARRAKINFVKAFSRAKKELLARTETRQIGKASRLSITNAIDNHISPQGNFKKFAYGNYTKLVYKRVLGMDVKTAKEQRKVPENGNLRDYLTIPELDSVQDLESKIAGFIEVSDTEGKNDKEIYQMVKKWLDAKGVKQ